MPQALWLPLSSPDAGTEQVGGKGASLARLARTGLPVPDGFHLTCAAYREFLAALAPPPDDLDSDESAAHTRRAILTAPLPSSVSEALEQGLRGLDDSPVAVRSSATAEDLPEASFAGQLESVLNVRGLSEVADAVRHCWASWWHPRAMGYRRRAGLLADTGMGIVVQRLVHARASGVMFTADPVTGQRDRIVINATWGLGESLVDGDVTPDEIVVNARNGDIRHRRLGDKAVRTVASDTGTATVAVTEADRRREVLDDDQATRLASLGARVVQLDGVPADIEWARDDNGFVLLQARPITGPAAREEWNDTHRGDFLWTSANLGEAMPSVMTPVTWSLMRRSLAEAMALPPLPGHELAGNIGGRLYLNYSVMMSTARAVGMHGLMAQAAGLVFGETPDSAQPPPIPVSRWRTLPVLLPALIRAQWRIGRYQRNLDRYIREYAERCQALRAEIADAADRAELARIWHERGQRLFEDGPRMLAAGSRVNGRALAGLRPWLRRFVDEDDVNTLASGAHTHSQSLASLGPLVGLRRLASGDIDQRRFVHEWGHRCPDELELSAPRPGEDPEWIARLLADSSSTVDVEKLLERQRAAQREAMERFTARYPGKAAQLRKRTALVLDAVRAREAARSESVRAMWAMRDFVRRCGEISGLGDEVFFLSIDEIVAMLEGHEPGEGVIAARRAAYEHYRRLPRYPTVIRGRFDPDTFTNDDRASRSASTLSGVAASSGVADGVARILHDTAEAERLAPGDILVTPITNIGWTPLFPSAAAVVTDVGAVLSHAAIVARELGIPAVVGCDGATSGIRDGDVIRVDGGRGVVEVVRHAPDEPPA